MVGLQKLNLNRVSFGIVKCQKLRSMHVRQAYNSVVVAVSVFASVVSSDAIRE